MVPRKTILVVDDEHRLRAFVRLLLEGEGYRVVEASSGDAAIDILDRAADPVDLLIVDVVMLPMDGFTLGRLLAERRRSVATLYMSGYAMEDLIDKFPTAAVDGILETDRFIHKPFHPRSFLDRVGLILGRAETTLGRGDGRDT